MHEICSQKCRCQKKAPSSTVKTPGIPCLINISHYLALAVPQRKTTARCYCNSSNPRSHGIKIFITAVNKKSLQNTRVTVHYKSYYFYLNAFFLLLKLVQFFSTQINVFWCLDNICSYPSKTHPNASFH